VEPFGSGPAGTRYVRQRRRLKQTQFLEGRLARAFLKASIRKHLERIRAEADLVAKIVDRSREQLAKSLDLLRSTRDVQPDTFLGRQNRTPIALPYQEE